MVILKIVLGLHRARVNDPATPDLLVANCFRR
jgi:hypothetical protein